MYSSDAIMKMANSDRLELYVTKKTSFLFFVSTCTQAKRRCTTLSFFVVSKQKNVHVNVLTQWAFPGYVNVSTKYETADLNDGYSGSLVITVAVERRRCPAVLFSVPTPHKPTTDWTIDHGLQKRPQILQIPTVVAKNSWCIKTTFKKEKKSLVLIFGISASGTGGTQRSCTRIVMSKVYETLFGQSRDDRGYWWNSDLRVKDPVHTGIRNFIYAFGFLPHLSSESFVIQ